MALSQMNDKNRYEINKIKLHIRKNEANKIIGSSINKQSVPTLRKEDIFDEHKDAHMNLTQLKKDFNKVYQVIGKQEGLISKMRREIDQLIMEENIVTQDVSNKIKTLDDYKTSFEIVKGKQDEETMNQKTYQHMLDRMKSDNIINSNKQAKLENLAEKLNYNGEKIQEEAQVQKKYNLQSKINMENEHNQRQKQLELFQNSLQQKQDAEQKREEWVRRQQEIAEVAAKEHKNANERKWRKLLLVHKFLNTFLKKKMETLMQNYSTIEQGFQKIKAATGISDTTEIVRKFLSREQTYGYVLISISEYEKKIDNLRVQNEELKNTFAVLKEELIPLENEMGTKKIDFAKLQQVNIVLLKDFKDHKDLEQFMERYKKGRVLKEKLHNWILKMLVIIEKIQGNYGKENIYDQYPESSFKEAFLKMKELIQAILGEYSSIPKEEAESIFLNMSKSILQDDLQSLEFLKRNVRVQPGKEKRSELAEQSYATQEDEQFKSKSFREVTEEDSLNFIVQNCFQAKSMIQVKYNFLNNQEKIPNNNFIKKLHLFLLIFIKQMLFKKKDKDQNQND